MHRFHWYLLALVLAVSTAGCRKPEKPKSAKKRYEEAVARSSREQMALVKFTTAIREILVWRQSQDVAPSVSQRQSMVKTLADKMTQVPTEGLPAELLKTWESMLKSWQALALNSTPDEELRKSGGQAARELNRQLEAHGITDIRF